MKILLVEDDAGDARLVLEMFKDIDPNRFDIERVERLEDALEKLEYGEFDLTILDLGLPDSSGLDTFFKFHAGAPQMPIVIMSGLNDEDIAAEAVRRGAQDYLVKGQADANLLARSVRYAVERNELLLELERLRLQEQENRKEEEFLSMEKFSERASTTVTSRMFGILPLKEALPEIFAEKVIDYSATVEKAIEQRLYNENYNISDELKKIAEDLGFLKAGPQDVLDIHCEAMRKKFDPKWTKRNKAYNDEGRLMIIELMGFLMIHYRRYSLLYRNKNNKGAEVPNGC